MSGFSFYNYLPLVGNTMQGVINHGGNDATNIGNLSGSTNSRNANDIVSNTSTFTSGNVVTGNTGKTIQDSGVAIANVITDSSNLVSGNIVSASAAKTIQDSGIIAANVITDASNLVSANLVSASGSKTIQDSGIIAANVITDSGSLVSGNVVTGNGTKTIQDGGTALSALALASSLNNYLLLAGGTMTGNIVMGAHNITNVALVDSNAGLSIGTSSATSLTIGASGITSTVNGNFNTTVADASWYCTTTYDPTFTAATNRLVPPVTSASNILTQFTFSTGVLTYTGTRSRTFRIAYNVTLNSATNNTTVTIWNSVNASTTLGSTTSRSAIRITATGVDFGGSVTDLVTLNTNDTIQLAAVCLNTASNIGFTFVACTVQAILN